MSVSVAGATQETKCVLVQVSLYQFVLLVEKLFIICFWFCVRVRIRLEQH